MAQDFRKFDEHGFPVPPAFRDLRYHDDQPPVRPEVSMRAKRLVIIALLIGIVVPTVFGPRMMGYAREVLAGWLGTRAERKYQQGDSRGALEDYTLAIGWNPKSWPLYLSRAELRLELNDLEGSLTDLNEFLELVSDDQTVLNQRRRRGPVRSDLIALGHGQRSWVLCRLGRHREAIDDASRAVQLAPTPQHLNARAYTRALAKVELPDALADIQTAIEDSRRADADFLDTRGFILHLLERNDEALRDMEQAIEIAERHKGDDWRHAGPQLDRRRFEQIRRRHDQALAVMYRHRGLILERLGRNAEATADLLRADQLGYDPANGVM